MIGKSQKKGTKVPYTSCSTGTTAFQTCERHCPDMHMCRNRAPDMQCIRTTVHSHAGFANMHMRRGSLRKTWACLCRHCFGGASVRRLVPRHSQHVCKRLLNQALRRRSACARAHYAVRMREQRCILCR